MPESSETLKEMKQILKKLETIDVDEDRSLLIKQHTGYVNFVLKNFKEAIIYFDSAQPWLYYYCIHTMNMFGIQLDKEIKDKMAVALQYCKDLSFGGGYKQLPHLAPTYAAFLTILSMGKEYLHLLDKEKIYTFFKKIKVAGKFVMHQFGQKDIRGSYIVAIITKFLHLNEDILEGVAQNILASQTPEGGISNVIGGQAHGGFTFCGVAALAVMGRLHELDVSRLMYWLSHRQVDFGGFNGRTNKLIDSCYSFWIGSVFNIVNNYFEGKISIENHLLYCQEELQKYILLYCQEEKGGLVDKPGKLRDIYHTCYALSGLSASQEFGIVINESSLKKIDPIYNLIKEKFDECKNA